MSNRVPIAEHRGLPWRVHELAADFEVEDVWRFPVTLSTEHTLATFRELMNAGFSEMSSFNPARVLLAVRLGIGRLLGWDQAGAGQGRLLWSRYAEAEGLVDADRPVPGAEFAEVYALPTEYLSEIENRTVQAALHLGRVPTGEGTSTVHLAVYVKPKGWLGRAYMALIGPFRRWIVYPAILRAAQRRWEDHLAGNSPLS